MLEPIWVPPPALEAARDLVRAREDARIERMRARHRLGKYLLRNDRRRLPGRSWGSTRRRALATQTFAFPAQQAAFDDYLQALDLIDARIEALDREIAALAAEGPWHDVVAQLRCLRGIDTLSALAIITEVGDFDGFATVEEFMSFAGLVLSESSSSGRRQGSITKAARSHVRRLLVEAA